MSWIDPFSVRVGRRYLATGGSGFSRLVNVTSVVGLALGITLMIVVSSVHHGFASARQASLFSVVPHAFLEVRDILPRQMNEILALEEVTYVRREFHGTVLVRVEKLNPVTFVLTGVEPESGTLESLKLEEGTLDSPIESNGILVAAGVALHLGLEIGEAVSLSFVKPSPTGLKTRNANFTVSGTYAEGIESELQSAYVNLNYLEDLELLDSGETGWNISVDDPFRVEQVFKDMPSVVTWIDTYGETFRSYQLERAVMYLVVTMVLMLASFNIVAGQSMLINVKQSDIAILTTMGASRRQLLMAFGIQGGFITLVGVVIGLTCGIAISLNFDEIFQMVDQALGVSLLDVSRFDSWPSQISTLDVVGAVVLATVLGAAGLVRPIILALRENPIHALNRSV